LLCDIERLWKEQGTGKPFQLSLERFNGTPSTIKQLVSYANRYLMIASGQDHLARETTPCLTVGDGVVRFVWIEKPRKYAPDDHERRFSRVYYLYREWRSTAQDDMFRGFSAMAEALGIEPVLARFSSKEAIAAEVLNIVKHHREQDSLPVSVVIALEDDAYVKTNDDILMARKLAAGKLFLTRTEFDNAQVHQNNERIGELIARCMVRDLAPALKKHPRRNKVLLIDADLGPVSSFRARKQHFGIELRRHDSGLAIHEQPIRISHDDFYSSGVAEKVRDATLAILKKDKDREIAAIYAGYFTLTWGAITAVKETGRTPADLSIYSEEIIYALIRELGNPFSFLKATCGVDPYHYGRYLLRVAATRSQDDDRDRAEPPEPFVLAKDDVTYDDPGKIGYMHELSQKRLSFHAGESREMDIRLEGEKYAWKPWMRQYLPHAYGPELLKARRLRDGRGKDAESTRKS